MCFHYRGTERASCSRALLFPTSLMRVCEFYPRCLLPPECNVSLLIPFFFLIRFTVMTFCSHSPSRRYVPPWCFQHSRGVSRWRLPTAPQRQPESLVEQTQHEGRLFSLQHKKTVCRSVSLMEIIDCEIICNFFLLLNGGT